MKDIREKHFRKKSFHPETRSKENMKVQLPSCSAHAMASYCPITQSYLGENHSW